MQQAAGGTADTAALEALMESIRPGKEAREPLPEWYIVAECMRAYHWTERQFWEDNSPAMITRLLWLEGVHAEKDEKGRRNAPNYGTDPPGRVGMEAARSGSSKAGR